MGWIAHFSLFPPYSLRLLQFREDLLTLGSSRFDIADHVEGAYYIVIQH